MVKRKEAVQKIGQSFFVLFHIFAILSLLNIKYPFHIFFSLKKLNKLQQKHYFQHSEPRAEKLNVDFERFEPYSGFPYAVFPRVVFPYTENLKHNNNDYTNNYFN